MSVIMNVTGEERETSKGIPLGKNKKQKKGDGGCFQCQYLKKLVIKNCFSMEDQY